MRVAGLVRKMARMSSSKEKVKAKMKPTSTPGRIIGKVTCRNVSQREAPSVIAASS